MKTESSSLNCLKAETPGANYQEHKPQHPGAAQGSSDCILPKSLPLWVPVLISQILLNHQKRIPTSKYQKDRVAGGLGVKSDSNKY